jgi:hypothetical protein
VNPEEIIAVSEIVVKCRGDLPSMERRKVVEVLDLYVIAMAAPPKQRKRIAITSIVGGVKINQ